MPRCILGFALVLFCALSMRTASGAPDPWEGRDAILARIKAPVFPARDFVITDYGAKAGGIEDARAAITAAIDACVRAGGGRVVIPAGSFLCDGPIHLKSKVNLHIAEGATLKFGTTLANYLPVVLTRWEGIVCYNYSPLIYAYGQTDIAVTGNGKIDGNGEAGFTKLAPTQRPDRAVLWKMGADKVPFEKRVFGEGHNLRPSGIQLYECTGVLIQGVTLVDMPFWCVHPVFCTNVTVDGIRVESMTANNDGCDPDSCRDVLIQNCYFATGDDAIAIKSGRDRDAWTLGRASENIIIRNCTAAGKVNAFAIGSEMSGNVNNIYIEDCKIVRGTNAIYTKGNSDRGGSVHDVYVRRIEIDTVRDAVVRFETNYHGWRGDKYPPIFQNFEITDVHCKKATAYAIYFDGQPADTLDDKTPSIRNIIMKRITVDEAEAGWWFRHATGVVCEDVKINGVVQPRTPAITPEDTKKLKVGD